MDSLLRNRTMGRVAAALVALVMVGGLLSFFYAPRRWWLPPWASTDAIRIDVMFLILMGTIGAVFMIVHVFLAFVLFRCANDPRRTAFYWHEDRRLEFLWTIVTVGVLVAFLIMGGSIWASMQAQPAGLGPGAGQDGDVLTLEVVSQQFAWNIRYPGPDGRLAGGAPRFISTENPLGIDPDDPAGADDVAVVNQMVLPVDQRVRIRLRALDVIHSFFVPHFRIKLDAVPGRVTEMWLQPSEKGDYEVACAELCGAGHYVMRARVSVVDREEYRAWVQRQAQNNDNR